MGIWDNVTDYKDKKARTITELADKGYTYDPTTGSVEKAEGGLADLNDKKYGQQIDNINRQNAEIEQLKKDSVEVQSNYEKLEQKRIMDIASMDFKNLLEKVSVDGDYDHFNKMMSSDEGLNAIAKYNNLDGIRPVDYDIDSQLMADAGLAEEDLEDMKNLYFVSGKGEKKKLVNIHNMQIENGVFRTKTDDSVSGEADKKLIANRDDRRKQQIESNEAKQRIDEGQPDFYKDIYPTLSPELKSAFNNAYSNVMSQGAYVQDNIVRGQEGTLADKDRLELDREKLELDKKRVANTPPKGEGDEKATIPVDLATPDNGSFNADGKFIPNDTADGKNVSSDVAFHVGNSNYPNDRKKRMSEFWDASRIIATATSTQMSTDNIWKYSTDSLKRSPIIFGKSANVPLKELSPNTFTKGENVEAYRVFDRVAKETANIMVAYSQLKSGAAVSTDERIIHQSLMISNTDTILQASAKIKYLPVANIMTGRLEVVALSSTGVNADPDGNILKSAVNTVAPDIIRSVNTAINSGTLNNDVIERLMRETDFDNYAVWGKAGSLMKESIGGEVDKLRTILLDNYNGEYDPSSGATPLDVSNLVAPEDNSTNTTNPESNPVTRGSRNYTGKGISGVR